MVQSAFTQKPWDAIPRSPKAPGGPLDYYFDFADPKRGPWLAAGEALASASWSITQGDGALSINSQGYNATQAYVWLSGGTLGASYLVSCTFTTTQGRGDTRSFWVDVQTR